jgi:hypothetical protein
LDKGAGCANLHLDKDRFAINFLKALGKEPDSPQEALHGMPSGCKAILKIQHSFQKERSDLADESEICRYLRFTVPALAHDFSSRDSSLYFLFTGKPFFCHERSFDVTSKSEKRCGFPGQGKGIRQMFQYGSELDVGVGTQPRFVLNP